MCCFSYLRFDTKSVVSIEYTGIVKGEDVIHYPNRHTTSMSHRVTRRVKGLKGTGRLVNPGSNISDTFIVNNLGKDRIPREIKDNGPGLVSCESVPIVGEDTLGLELVRCRENLRVLRG